MKCLSGQVRLSASDLSNHLSCHHLTAADLAVARGERKAPEWRSPDAWVLQQRGFEHERAYLTHLESQGLTIADLGGYESDAIAATAAAMRDGAAVIAQAAMAADGWFGRADVLRRVERPSTLGAWSYEVYDCKLACETKAATILQLSLYSNMVADIQGVMPEWMYVVTPGRDFEPEQYRTSDFAAYYRYVKARLRGAMGPESLKIYPEPNPHCSVCRWWSECDAQWRRDDHLTLVAGISKLQRKQLEAWGTRTTGQLAALPLPLQSCPERGSGESYVRVREQARVQVAGRNQGRPVHELLDIFPQQGLCRLPEPSPGDLFFDLEGDPFVDGGGREYLFGFVAVENGAPEYHHRWALTAEDEKRTFQWFVDYVTARWAQDPAMHVYHYAAYEPSALKRLMGRYATREDEVDRMLRAGLLVDLRTVVKQAVRASVEEYSLKALEAFHGFERLVPLEQARQALHRMEHTLELARPTDLDESVGSAIAGYNADDCLSTRSLRDWLERERAVAEQRGQTVERPPKVAGDPTPELNERQQRVAKLIEELTPDIPADPAERTREQAARWLLANLLDWHRREMKFEFGEYYRLRDATEEELVDDRSGLGGLRSVSRIGWERKRPIYRYAFEKQETKIRAGDKVRQGEVAIGEVVEICLAEGTIDILKAQKAIDFHPTSIFVDCRGPNTDAMAGSLLRLGEWVKTNGVDEPGDYRAARDLLLREPPRLRNGGGPFIREGESAADAASRIVSELQDSVLAIQGPPGSGKTYAGARMICSLARQGKKIGVTAMSHKVIRNLLEEVVEAAGKCGLSGLTIVEKVTDGDVDEPKGIQATKKNEVARAALEEVGPVVVAGTSWLWSREDFRDSVDVLFVDEAGQMSLANVLAVAQACRNLVLLGDPQQLEQPLQGSHPEGAEVSALEHLLNGAKTIRAEQGLFLDKTWRLHPKICEFTSEVFYESRLQSRDGMERQRIEGHPWLGAAGLWHIPVVHEGNQNSSTEEVDRIDALVRELVRPGVTWVDAEGMRRQVTLDDILIIAPYNAQVSDLASRIRGGRVGTVDKFQGQEAPVVIYSLTTSSPEDAPRGMEFLYSLNRLNVATSRGRAIEIVVGSPRLLEPECRNVRQMRLASALCRFAEMARKEERGDRDVAAL